MKRFHVHMHVNDLDKNIAFYSALFNQPPTRTEGDYAKWMLEDPPVNFAISTRGASTGLDHLGFQVSSAEELGALKAQAQAADMALLDEGETTCCYARSDKYWITDPQGVAKGSSNTGQHPRVQRSHGTHGHGLLRTRAHSGNGQRMLQPGHRPGVSRRLLWALID
jgi:lactoylglutathione lyase